MRSVRLRAFCKVNLCLEVLGRRDDGYHDLATIFHAVSLADELTVVASDGDSIEVLVPGGGAPEGPENLSWQAAEAYRMHRGWPGGVRVELEKMVPSGAGLGGGSSDAAAVLMALAQLDAQPPAWEELHSLARGLGADVAFFLMTGAALGVGRGDELSSLPELPPCRIVLARPDLAISTAEAYGMLTEADYSDGRRARAMAEALEYGEALHEVAGHVYNGFSRALVERWPVLAELTGRLERAGAEAAAVTGSGSAVFGIFEEEAAARTAAKALSEEGFWARITEPVPCGASILS